MKPRLLIGLMGVLLAMPSVVAAQRGAVAGFAPSGAHFASVASGSAPHAANVVRSSSSVPSAVPVSASVVHARAGVHSGDVPSRHAGLSSAQRTQSVGNRVFTPIGSPSGGRRNPPPVTNPRVVYILGAGGYYYAAPADASVDETQDSAEVEGQQADGQQAGAPNDRYGDRHEARDVERADNRDDGSSEADAPASARSH